MSKPFKYSRLSKDDAALLLVDHQAGLISLVQDFGPSEFKNNVLAVGACGKYFKLPTILTTSFEEGPNGPLVPELKEMFPNAPYIARPGNINAWDNEDFVNAVKNTGRKQLIMPASLPKSVWLFQLYQHWSRVMKYSSSPMPRVLSMK